MWVHLVSRNPVDLPAPIIDRAPIKPDLAIERGREPLGARTVAADVPHRQKLLGDQGGTSGLRSGVRRVYVG